MPGAVGGWRGAFRATGDAVRSSHVETTAVRGVVFRIQRYALHDGPGIRTTVFLKGCPLACPWCHNPEGLDPAPQTLAAAGDPPQAQVIGRRMTVAAVMAEIEKDTLFYDQSGGGATFSGGEPLMQSAFLNALLDACAEQGIHTVLDTSGYAPRRTLLAAAGRARQVFFDLKIMDDGRHAALTGVSNRRILQNLTALSEGGTPVRVRFPVVPGMTDDTDNVERLAAFVASLGRVEGIDLLPFHPTAEGKYRRLERPYRSAGLQPPSARRLAALRRRIEAYGVAVGTGEAA